MSRYVSPVFIDFVSEASFLGYTEDDMANSNFMVNLCYGNGICREIRSFDDLKQIPEAEPLCAVGFVSMPRIEGMGVDALYPIKQMDGSVEWMYGHDPNWEPETV